MTASVQPLSRIRIRAISAPATGIAILAAGIVLLGAAVVLAALIEHGDAPTADRPAFARVLVRVVSAAAMLPIGALMVARLPRHPIGWILSAAGLGIAVAVMTGTWATYSHHVHALPLERWAAWTAEWASSPIVLVPGVALLVFPDGRVPSRRWRPALWCGIAAAVIVLLAGMLGAPQDLGFAANPLLAADTARTLGDFLSIGWVLVMAATAAGIVALVRRQRAADPDALDQLRLMRRAGIVVAAAFAACFAGALIAPEAFDAGAVAATGSLAALSVVMGIAILRHRLYGLDVYVDRALVLTTTTLLLAMVYAVAVVAVSALLSEDVNVVAALPATVLVAIAFHPLHERVRRSVATLLHGQRDDPYAAVSRLGERLGEAMAPDRVLPVMVETIADALRLPYVAVGLEGADGLTSFGTPVAGVALELDLEHAGQRVGSLLVGARRHHEALSVADRRLLEVFAARASAAVSAVAMSVEIQQSHGRLVTAREEERRRLRADLHDDLGPKLAGAILTIDAARRVMRTDPGAADRLLDQAAAGVEGTVDDVRRVVYALRPPALDQLGLLGALEQQAAALSGNGRTCAIDAPAALRPLPAAVEVAVLRIAQEALTNVTRHADASRSIVRLRIEDGLDLEIADDGTGLSDGATPGVGLSSMRERAIELGGSFAVGKAPGGGTTVRVRLPLPQDPITVYRPNSGP